MGQFRGGQSIDPKKIVNGHYLKMCALYRNLDYKIVIDVSLERMSPYLKKLKT